MSNLTTNDRADVLMHNGQQYVRIDYLTRIQAKHDALRTALESMSCECDEYTKWVTGQPSKCPRCAALDGAPNEPEATLKLSWEFEDGVTVNVEAHGTQRDMKRLEARMHYYRELERIAPTKKGDL